MTKEKEVKKKILDSLSKVEIKECECCGKFISKDEFERGEGACFKCWDKGNLN